MTAGQVGRVLTQGVYFLLVARALGTREFGAFASALAIVFILVPFAGFGMGNVMISVVARDRSAFPHYWGNSLIAVTVISAPLVALAVVAGRLIVPQVHPIVILAIGVADLAFARVADIAGQAFQAVGQLSRTAIVTVVPSFLRACAAVAFTELGGHTAAGWAVWYAAAGICGGAVAAVAASHYHGMPRINRLVFRRHAKQGMYFAVGQASATIYGDIDKAMLGRLASLQVTGVYAAGYRAMSFAFIPVMALLFSAYARFFQVGAAGTARTLQFARRLLPAAFLYGVLAAPVLWLGAGLIPIVLGSDYAKAADVVRWLALVPLCQALYYLPGDALTGASRQGMRSVLQIAAAVVNVALNLILIPRYSWLGAVIATYAAIGGLGIALWLTLLHAARPRPLLEEVPAT